MTEDPLRLLSTGEVAELCGVSPKTARNWCARGLLKSFRLPNSRHRRVQVAVLIEFAKEHDMPLQICHQRSSGL